METGVALTLEQTLEPYQQRIEKTGVEFIWEIGEALTEAKHEVIEFTGDKRAPGFTDWHTSRFGFSKATASRYMKAFKEKQADASPIWGHKERVALAQPTLENEIAENYQIVYADPPWSYGNSATRANANSHYPTMSIQDICDYKPDDEHRVEEIIDENAVLFMWVTPPLLPEVWDIYGAWGFEYKTVAFNWVKLNNDESVYLGIGNYTRSNVEYLTVAVRKGNDNDNWLRRQRNDISNVVMAKRLDHSEKPHIFRTLIEEMYGEVKRIELFARTKTPGWDVSGNQIKQELLDV